jgi:trigger factor
MKIVREKTENCQLTLKLEVEAHELEESLNEAYHRLVSRVSVPGFRKGKVPRAILEQHLGKEAMLEEALEHLVPQLYKQAVESERIDAIDQPQVDILQTDPVVLEAVIPLRPVVTLGNYGELRLEQEPVEVSDEQIETAIKRLQQERGTWLPVDRPVRFDDLITLDIEADVEGTPVFAKSVGYEDLASMREQIKADLRAKAEEKSRTEFRQKVLDAVTDLSEVDYPPILIDRGIDELIKDEIRSFGEGIKGLEDYLRTTGKTMEEHREELRPLAQQRVVYSLVMGKVAEEEEIKIDASEVDNKVEEITRNSQEKEKMEKFLALPQIRESIGYSLHTQKTLDRLVQIASGNDERKTKEDE